MTTVPPKIVLSHLASLFAHAIPSNSGEKMTTCIHSGKLKQIYLCGRSRIPPTLNKEIPCGYSPKCQEKMVGTPVVTFEKTLKEAYLREHMAKCVLNLFNFDLVIGD